MYICPTCQKEFKTDVEVSKHYLKCWKEHNPNHKSTPAPRSEDIVVAREVDDGVLDFFNSLKGN